MTAAPVTTTAWPPATEPFLPFESVRALLRKYRDRHPAKLALYSLDEERGIDFATLDALTERVVCFLHAEGIGRGDRVVVLADERIEKLVLMIAAWRLGAVACPFHTEINLDHLRFILTTIAPKIVFWHESVDGPSLAGHLRVPVVRFDRWPAAGADAAELFTRLAREPAGAAPDVENGPDDIACIFSTSGTTDKPKCVVWDHLALWLTTLNTIDFTGQNADDRMLEYRTFSWLSPQIISLSPFVMLGFSLYLANGFSRSRFFDWIRNHRITVVAGVPTVINMLLNRPVEIGSNELESVRIMTSSTAPLSPEQWQRFETMYGIRLLQFFGASEVGWFTGNRHYNWKFGTVGQPAMYTDFAILDDAGNVVPPSVEGEVGFRGRCTANASISPDGAWEDRVPTRETEYSRAGDLAVMDAEGFITVTGRTKDLIIRGGVNIAPLEIDRVLMRHPQIQEAAAVGVPDPIFGEEVVAYVVARAALTTETVKAHCATSLPASKVPKEVHFVDSLPRSDRGKIRRAALKDHWLAARQGISNPDKETLR
ncbi:MAG: acyl--CoA ligase [Alphaproteobacteria bacterium]|nr:acyl--CoA ligase [Alphaproteobacteria bacterium]